MTNKQTHAAPEEKPSAELLPRRFKLMDEFVAEIRRKNIDTGLDPKYMKLDFYERQGQGQGFSTPEDQRSW